MGIWGHLVGTLRAPRGGGHLGTGGEGEAFGRRPLSDIRWVQVSIVLAARWGYRDGCHRTWRFDWRFRRPGDTPWFEEVQALAEDDAAESWISGQTPTLLKIGCDCHRLLSLRYWVRTF